MKKLAVILVNWNGREITLDALRSLYGVEYPGLNIIVVDNASEDGSVEAIAREFPHVDLLRMGKNLRFAGGNNAGITRALSEGAELVMLLNNDTTVDPEFARYLVSRLEADPRCGAVAPKIYYYGEPDRLWFAGGAISFWTGTMRHVGIRETDHGQHDSPRHIEYASGCCILVRADVISRVGLLDESYFIYGEDADWSMRIRRAGFDIWYEPRAKVWHKVSVSSGGHFSQFKLKNKFLSNFRFFARYARWYHWATFPWMNLMVNAWSAGRYLLSR